MNNTSSVDYEELKKFNKTCQEWWDTNGEFKILHQINPLRIDYIKSIVQQHFNINKKVLPPLKDLKFLDIGCGGGIVSKSIYELGGNVTGLDANEYNTQAATLYSKQNNLDIKYINSTVEEYSLNNQKKYDVVLCLEVIEHVANPKEFIHNVSKLVNDKGIVIFSTINRNMKSYMQAILVAEYILNWVPKKTHQYSKFIKPSELVNMVYSTSLKLYELKGLKLSLENYKWVLTDNIDVNYFAVFKQK